MVQLNDNYIGAIPMHQLKININLNFKVMEVKKEIAKQYFAMHKEMFLEKQFNRKVELNIKISKFKKENKVDILGSEPLYEIFVGEGIDKEFIGQISCKYKKDRHGFVEKIGYDYKLINN